MKIDIVVFDEVEEKRVDAFIEKHELAYANAYNRAEDYIEYEGIEISEKLYTILQLLENNWHIERVKGAIGGASDNTV
jgi:hypothetical protein